MRLFTPVQMGNLCLKNRIVFAPTSMGRAGVGAYEQIAAGGTGLLIMADLSVVPSMLGEPGLDSMEHADYYHSVVEACHRYGCKISAQLFHPEYDPVYAKTLYVEARRGQGISPAQARQKIHENSIEYCDKMKPSTVEEIIQKFSEAAKRAKELGFDMVQIHGDRLLGSFTSPLFNHRTDQYGAHLHVPARIVGAVKSAVPDLPIDYKLTIRMEEEGLGRGGIARDEIPEFVQKLDDLGVDGYHVTLANHTDIENTIPRRNHPILAKEGCFAGLAKEVKRHTSKPVCTVGKWQTIDKMEKVLEDGIELVGMSRQLIADPRWPDKVLGGKEDTIIYCRYCNQRCVKSLHNGAPVGCIFH